MAGPVGQAPLILTRAFVSETILSLVQPGQSVAGTIQGSEGNLMLAIAGQRVPLPRSQPQLPLGTAVRVSVVQTDDGVHLQIEPKAVASRGDAARPAAIARFQQPAPLLPQTTPAGPAPDALSGILAAVLRSLAPAVSANEAAPLLPPNVPLSENLVRAILNLHQQSAGASRDVETVLRLVSQATRSGAIAPDVAEQIVRSLEGRVGSDASRNVEALKHAVDTQRRSLEAKLAAASKSENPVKVLAQALRGDLRAELSRIAETESLVRFLRQNGKLEEFEGAVARIVDRAAASNLQAGRAPDSGYLFFTIPFSPDQPIRSANLHIFGEGGGDQRRGIDRSSTIVIDIVSKELGDVWVKLVTHAANCTCSFRLHDGTAVESVADRVAELDERFKAIGFETVSIDVAQWDGDRLREVSRLMAPLGRIRLDA